MFQVIWYDSAIDSLAEAIIVADLPTREALARGITWLNAQLLIDPVNLGESRPGKGRRIAFERPCGIRFTVDPANRIVRVTQFWIY